MKPEVTLKYLSYLQTKKEKGEGGFTLIELLVVVIIIGVLAAVALPNLLGQVGKARESEAKNGVGAINRAQQAYHFERQEFADSTDLTTAQNPLGVVIDPEYYTFTVAGSDSDSNVSAINANAATDGTRDFAGSVNFNNGAYTVALCQADNIGANVAAANGACTTGVTLR